MPKHREDAYRIGPGFPTVGILYVNENLGAAGDSRSVRYGVVINVVELLTENIVNPVGCKRGSTDSHRIVVAGILTLENCGAERVLVTEVPRGRDTD